MINFFRKIRQNLLIENKTGKYFKYATGEIILVVIGILIALQINNWNEEKKISNTELEILKLMRKNLNSDLRDMNGNIEFYRVRQKAAQVVLKSLDDSLYKNDSLSFSYANLGLSPFFIETTSAYENLKSIGFEIIKNDSLKENIMSIYSKSYQWMEELEDGHSNFTSTKLEPLLTDNLIVENLLISAKPINLVELRNNHRFKEILKKSYFFNYYMIERNKELMNSVAILVQQITDELDKRE
jgi:hypothetical protein